MIPGGRTCLLVLGMHRSGTSAVARMLSLLGAALPEPLMEPMPWNPAGHWEPKRLVELHDLMLHEARSRWDDWRPMPFEGLLPARRQYYREAIRRIVAEDFGDASLLVLKDPRVCRFVGFFREALSGTDLALRYVLPVRHPAAVAASLAARDGMDAASASLLWLRHVLDAERDTRGAKRTIIDYDELLRDWRAVADRAGAELALTWPSRERAEALMGEAVTGELRHHTPAHLDGAVVPVRWAEQVHEALLSRDATAAATLDSVRAEFDEQCSSFGSALAGQFNQAAEMEAIVAEHRRIIAARDEEIRHLRLALAAQTGGPQ